VGVKLPVRPLGLVSAMLIALCIGGPAAHAQQNVLRFNHVLGPSEPYHAGFLKWAQRVARRTNGKLKIEVFHSAQLGVEEDIIEQMRKGASIGQNTDSARLGNYVKDMAVMNGPYFAETLEQVWKLTDSPTVRTWQDELATKHGLKVVCFDWVQGLRHFFTNKPIRTPQDLDGLRIRTPPAPIWQESIRALGATPTAMAFGDMYPGLQQKAIDGVELVYANIPGGRFYEVLKYANETGHILLINFEVVSSQWFDTLPADQQTALVEECRTAGREASAEIAKINDDIKANLKRKGMEIVSDVNLAAFREAGRKAYEVLGIGDAKKAVDGDTGRSLAAAETGRSLAATKTASLAAAETGRSPAAAETGRSLAADEPARIRIALIQPLTSYLSTNVVQFTKELESKTGGAFKFEVFDNSRLYKDYQILEAVASGAVEMGAIPMAQFTAKVPVVGVLEQPFLFNFEALVGAATHPDSEIRRQLDSAVLEATGARILWWQSDGQSVFFSKGRPTRTPSQIENLKVSVFGDNMTIFTRLCGGIPLVNSASDQREALGEGTVDVVMTGIGNVDSHQLWKVSDTITRTEHAPIEFIVIINEKLWQSFTAEQKAIATAAARRAELELRQQTAETEAAAYAFARDKRMAIHELTPDEVAEWRECSAIMMENYVSTLGVVGQRMMAAYGRLRTLPCCSAGPKGRFTRR
jgi:tripartite ATP-independent transporter DctP family solute receptor